MKSYIIRYTAQLFFFLGIGLISGSLVHLSRDIVLYGSLGIVGLILFITGTLLQQYLLKENNSQYITTIVYAVLFAAGVGVASGGIQHFAEVGYLAPLYIAGGIALSFFVFGKKERIESTKKNSLYLGLISLGVFLLLGGISLALLTVIPMSHGNSQNNGHGHGHGKTESEVSSETHSMDMSVENSYEFVSGMIPHHQEAIDTALFILKNSQDPAMIDLVTSIIRAQTTEISLMEKRLPLYRPEKTREQEHTSEHSTYMNMMRPLEVGVNSNTFEKQFLEDMIIHHQGAISMAIDVLTFDDTPEEIRTFAYAVIRDQSAEIVTMDTILQKKK